MRKSAVIHARIEPRTKRRAEDVLRDLGMSPTEAIRLFYRQICLRSGLPFRVEIPNAETGATLMKSRKGQGVEPVESVDKMFAGRKDRSRQPQKSAKRHRRHAA
jgi:DNA-damage-inducible protein J